MLSKDLLRLFPIRVERFDNIYYYHHYYYSCCYSLRHHQWAISTSHKPKTITTPRSPGECLSRCFWFSFHRPLVYIRSISDALPPARAGPRRLPASVIFFSRAFRHGRKRWWLSLDYSIEPNLSSHRAETSTDYPSPCSLIYSPLHLLLWSLEKVWIPVPKRNCKLSGKSKKKIKRNRLNIWKHISPIRENESWSRWRIVGQIGRHPWPRLAFLSNLLRFHPSIHPAVHLFPDGSRPLLEEEEEAQCTANASHSFWLVRLVQPLLIYRELVGYHP